MTNTSAPTTIHLKDYTPPAFLIDSVDLRFELGETATRVMSSMQIHRNPQVPAQQDLCLDGQALALDGIQLDGAPLDVGGYELNTLSLRVKQVPDQFRLELQTTIHPERNTALEGLYKSSGNFCTQCEAEGFRNITWFLDRPDVMAVYTTTIVADRRQYPVLLGNGNKTDQGLLDDGLHYVCYADPFPKPAYLFALVAGDLACVRDHFTTRSGRNVALEIYVQHHNADRCGHAMASLQKAMRWDEEVFGLEYDLATYMIVVVDDFNMGAMENKGLNVFNSKYVLARPDTATDTDFANIEGVIAHEYFHNWTGNRVTCRDWFQLSLKEGLTVFRDQLFSADMGSRALKRIDDVRILRSHQFAEDAGPMAHPVRPDTYAEINNFYTVTIYNKGAEVIRMLHTLLGADGFRCGLDLYFERHDGQAVTTEDFVCAMEAANEVDLTLFRNWYTQAGTPRVHVNTDHDPEQQSFTLHLEQACPDTPGQTDKAPFHIPLSLALLDEQGRELPLKCSNPDFKDGLLQFTQPHQSFRFEALQQPPMLSIGRDFSAPVIIRIERDNQQLATLMAHETDPFNRWDAAQSLSARIILQRVHQPQTGEDPDPGLPETFVQAFSQTLLNRDADKTLIAAALSLPAETYIADQMEVIDVDTIHRARRFVRGELARQLRQPLLEIMHENTTNQSYEFTPEAVARRSLKNLCLGYLMEQADTDISALCMAQLENADNMTDSLAALVQFANIEGPQSESALGLFEQRWLEDPLVMDKWFAVQATSHLPNTLDRVKTLMRHRAYDNHNPNRVRSLVGAFCHANPIHFHNSSGDGYRFLADRVLQLDQENPQIAAHLLGAMSRWRKFSSDRQRLMRTELERVFSFTHLSSDSREVAAKILGRN